MRSSSRAQSRAWLLLLLVSAMASCTNSPKVAPSEARPDDARGAEARPDQGRAAGAPDPHAADRERMVTEQIMARGITSPAVITALRAVPRHRFVPEAQRAQAHRDGPLPIGERQTISQPYIVALMTDLAGVDRDSRVLEIGTGSGYQVAVLAELCREVYTIEIIEPLARRSHALLAELGYSNIHTRIGDGYRGWPEAAPFDAIVVTAAPPHIPTPLKEQLALGGRLVIPVGQGAQQLRVITRTDAGFTERIVSSVRFVPMTGEAQR